VWQLNENWPTGGWGLLEYGSKSGMKGQVIGGRWTAPMYLMKYALYRDVFASCGVIKSGEYTCYCRNDGMSRLRGRLLIKSLNLATGVELPIATCQLDMQGGSLSTFYCISRYIIQRVTHKVVAFVSVAVQNGAMLRVIHLEMMRCMLSVLLTVITPH